MAEVRVSCRRPCSLAVLCSLLHCFWMLSTIHVVPLAAASLSFNLTFSKPENLADLSQLNYSGDASPASPEPLQLTRNQSSTNSVGRATYAQPVPLWDAATGEMASFTTTFSFLITPADSTSTYPTGDGMAFFLGHFGSTIPAESGGGGLALLPTSTTNGTGDSTFVAVEFDTFRNPEYGDISSSHVAINVNSLHSVASMDTTSPTKNLTSGYEMVATVTYENVTRLLALQLTINDTSYYVNATVDLKRYLPQLVAVGFSAATGKGGEQHHILSWSFTSTLEPPASSPAPAPPSPPLAPPAILSRSFTSTLEPPASSPAPASASASATSTLEPPASSPAPASATSTLEPPASSPAPAPPSLTLTPPAADNIQHHPKKIMVISVLVTVIFLLACAAVLGFLVWQKRKRTRSRGTPPDESNSIDDKHVDRSESDLARGVAASSPKRYKYRELAAATNNFAEDGKLGRGGFGSVYRGTLAVGGQDRPVAIKIFSSESSAQGRKEFETEVRIISRLKHRNLVQLLGWCEDNLNGLLLVYELVAKGSLDKHLHSSIDGERFLTWPERYQIILGLGSALRYLHQEWEQCVVHGDIKPSNIMLDDSLDAKLGDFGLARLGDHGGRWQTTMAVKGTAGYIDPEFVNTLHPSTHSDVYSFGIVLLEIVSGRCPAVLLEGGAHFILLKWVWGLYGRNAILDAAEQRLRAAGDEVHDRCMERVLVVGLWCAHPDQSERPSIAQAMNVLQSEDARLPSLPLQMYKMVSDVAATERASYGALCIESYDGNSSTTTTTTGESKLSSSSPSTTDLLRESKEGS